jgi:hypothetical protein
MTQSVILPIEISGSLCYTMKCEGGVVQHYRAKGLIPSKLQQSHTLIEAIGCGSVSRMPSQVRYQYHILY